MDTVFLKILNMSIAASWLVLAVLLFRPLLKRAPKALSVLLWGLVGVRLVLPYFPESIFSLVPSAETVPTDIVYSKAPAIESGIHAINSTINPIINQTFSPSPMNSVNPLQVVAFAASALWIAGMTAMLVYSLISCFRILRKVREAAFLHDNVWMCDKVESPFIFGVFRPRIYLPSSMSEQDITYVLAHENAHLKRRDYLWKPLGFLLLTVYWFNPLLWVAYVLLCRDIELACDEKVIREMGAEVKKPYSNALINCSVPRRMIAACPLAFGEVGVKGRVKSVLNYKKPAFWIIVAAVIVCLVIALRFLTNPVTIPEDKLKTFIDCQIAEHHQAHDSNQYACCIDWKVLGTKRYGSTRTIYMWVLYQEYSYSGNMLTNVSGAHTPTAITVKKENGSYTLVEYWTPRDGSHYIEDIRDKFPVMLWRKASNSQLYIEEQQKNCRKMAKEYFESGNTFAPPQSTKTIEELREMYPEYFDLNTAKGLEVYVWQMAANSYSCGLLPNRNQGYTAFELMDLSGTSIEDMKLILSTYDITTDNIAIIPYQNMYSSYIPPAYVIPNYEGYEQILLEEQVREYEKRLRKMFFGKENSQQETIDDWELSMEITFHDDSRFDLVLKHHSQWMPENGTLTASPEYALFAVHDGIKISFGDYMRVILEQEYIDPELSWDTVLYTIEPDSELVIEGNFLVTYGQLPPGEYVLYKPVTLTTSSGEVMTKLYSVQFVVVN